jgi:(E)-4-hydroxy-3-methyl-but-2-enyl pyrophosphate reductase
MKLILANPRGFCAGVNMAIESLETAIKHFGTPIYVFHEIVHNRPIVERFRQRGVVFVDGLHEVPNGHTVLFSAHGVSPAIRQEAAARDLRAIDATCPLVTKVHLEAVKYAREGYTIVLIGHEGHDEVIGTMGEAPEAIVLVESEADVERLPFGPQTKLAFLTPRARTTSATRRKTARRPSATSSARRTPSSCSGRRTRRTAGGSRKSPCRTASGPTSSIRSANSTWRTSTPPTRFW